MCELRYLKDGTPYWYMESECEEGDDDNYGEEEYADVIDSVEREIYRMEMWKKNHPVRYRIRSLWFKIRYRGSFMKFYCKKNRVKPIPFIDFLNGNFSKEDQDSLLKMNWGNNG